MSTGTPSWPVSLIAGGLAGTTVDVALFPLDTIKTRLQAPNGFFASGGFRGIYNGLNSAALGSAPSAALFFVAYDASSSAFTRHLHATSGPSGPSEMQLAGAHLVAASIGEVSACLVRVPTDNVKVRLQSGAASSLSDAIRTLSSPATVAGAAPAGFYRGFGMTVMRDVPFAMMQFPLYEFLKRRWFSTRSAAARAASPYADDATITAQATLTPAHAALCGSIAGGVSAAATTPIDVVRTRLMLGHDPAGEVYKGAMDCVRRVVAQEGWRKLFAGLTPRVTWISIGGSVFFGAVETYKGILAKAGLT